MNFKHIYSLVALASVISGCVSHFILVSSDTGNDEELIGEYPDDTLDSAPCRNDEDCANGLVCDGVEKCMEGRCTPGEPMICDDGNPCTSDSCSAEEGGCVFAVRDADGDGFGDATCGGLDCDDSRPYVYPGAPESCEPGEDHDCSGARP